MNFSSLLIKEGDFYSRIFEIKINKKILPLPAYFPSISSFGIKFTPLDLLTFIKEHGVPRVLISAYDIHNADETQSLVIEILNKIKDKTIAFLDSGQFESFWKSDDEWNFNLYISVLKKLDIDFFSTFDEITIKALRLNQRNKSPKPDFEIYDNIHKNAKFIPIIHGTTPTNLIENIKSNFKRKNFEIFAISERDLGFSIIEKMRIIIKVKKELLKIRKNPIIHLLGCGHPISLMIYVLLGIDSFDSLDWIKYIVDIKSYNLLNIEFLPFLNCNCKICQISDFNYVERALLHNLNFYESFFNSIRKSIFQNEYIDFLKTKIDSNIYHIIERIIQ